MLRLEARTAGSRARLGLFGDDGDLLAEWAQEDEDLHIELRRSLDGHLATVVAGEAITVVRLKDGCVVGASPTGQRIEAVLPLDARWTLKLSGDLALDRGHTGFIESFVSFARVASEQDPGEFQAGVERMREELAAATRVATRRRLALQDGTAEVVLHESTVAPVAGGEVLLWPPIDGAAGVLLRHAIETDDGARADTAPQRPWLVRPDRTVVQLPFDLGVSPLMAWPDGRWLLPGSDTVWRDDYDEPLTLLAQDGALEPLLVGGRPVRASRVLREAAPEVLAALTPAGPNDDVPWSAAGARLDVAGDELHLAIDVERDERIAVVVAALPLDGAAPARLIAHLEPTPGGAVAAAP